MFDAGVIDDGNVGERSIPVVQAVPVPAWVGPSVQAERYGAGRGVNLPVVLAVVAFHILLVAAIIQARTIYVQKKQAALAVVNLMPPPPPPASEEPPPPSQPKVVSPPPIVRVPLPVQTPIQTTPIITPQPVQVAVVSVAPPAPPAPPAMPSTVQAGDLSTRMISGKPPRYPTESRRLRQEGTVVLALILGVDGRVETVNIARSSGFAKLDEAARSAARSWRWEPTIRNGQAVKVAGTFEIPFHIQG